MTLTPMKSIRKKCIDCCCGQLGEVRLCPAHTCPLYPYRLGKRPVVSGCDCTEDGCHEKSGSRLADSIEEETDGDNT